MSEIYSEIPESNDYSTLLVYPNEFSPSEYVSILILSESKISINLINKNDKLISILIITKIDENYNLNFNFEHFIGVY